MSSSEDTGPEAGDEELFREPRPPTRLKTYILKIMVGFTGECLLCLLFSPFSSPIKLRFLALVN